MNQGPKAENPESPQAAGPTGEVDQGRCWIFGSTEPLDPQELGRGLSGFISQWQSHGAAVTGGWQVLFDQFLVIRQTPEGADASGCSIDSMKGQIAALEKKTGNILMDSGRIFYRDASGRIRAVSRQQFKALAAEGGIHLETEVFDTTLTAAADLRPGVFNKPLKDSWHLRLTGSALSRA